MKRKHWTQTVKGRRHMKNLAKKRAADRLTAAKENKNGKVVGSPKDFHIAYAFGSVERWLHIYEDTHGLPRGTVTHRVGDLLRVEKGR